MDYAIVLDKEIHFARKLCARLQARFPACLWSPISSLKEAYRQVEERRAKPLMLIYTPEYYPAWKPLWACPSIQLRSQPLFEELFGLPQAPPPTVGPEGEHPSLRVYRLNLRGILSAVENLWPQAADAFNASALLSPGKVSLLASDLAGKQLENYLRQPFRQAQERGLRIFLVPLMDSRHLPALTLKGCERLDRADLGSLIERLESERLSPLQLLPYFFPTTIPGLLSLYTSERDETSGYASDALRHLVTLIQRLLRRSEAESCSLILCHKSQTQLLENIAALCDGLCLLGSSAAFRNPAAFRLHEGIKASLPPGFPIQENCLAQSREALTTSQGGQA